MKLLKTILNTLNSFYLKPENRGPELYYRGYQIVQGRVIFAGVLAFLLIFFCSGCCSSHLVVVRERHVASYDVGKAIERAIQRVENTGHFISDIKIEENSSHKISANEGSMVRPIEWKNTYDITVCGDRWEKRLVYYYWRTAPNYEEVKEALKKRMKDANVWMDE